MMNKICSLLCVLLSVICCSCVSRTYRVVYEYPRTYEGAFLTNNSEPDDDNEANMKLTQRWHVYECEGKWYLPVRRMGFRKKVRNFSYSDEVWDVAGMTPVDDKTWYLPITAELANELRTPSKESMKHAYLAEGICTAELVASLPSQARAHAIRQPIYSYSKYAKTPYLLAQTDSHTGASAWLCWPLSAILFAVEIPATVVFNAIAYTGYGVAVLICPECVIVC